MGPVGANPVGPVGKEPVPPVAIEPLAPLGPGAGGVGWREITTPMTTAAATATAAGIIHRGRPPAADAGAGTGGA